MHNTIITPIKAGQICKIMTPMEDEDPDDVYILAEDPTGFGLDDSIYLTNLKDLQRNLEKPQLAPQIAIIKSDLTVVANSLEDYIASWNN